MSTGKRRVNRRELLHKGALGGLGLASLGPLSGLLDVSRAFASDAEGSSGGMGRLIAAAKKEGHLNTIALPRDWADYGEIMDTFQAKYHIAIANANPLGSSAQEVQAIISLKGQSRAPDVVDVSPTFAQKGKQEGLYVPYKVATWDTIPGNLKDPQGYWTGDYWGVQSFLSNNKVVKEPPKDWDDLLSRKLRGMVAIDGDPRQAGDAFAAVMAASLANGGSLDNIEPGINFFARLKKVGNWNPTGALTANIAKGTTPIAIKWDYLNLAVRDELKGNPAVTVTIPRHGVYGGYYGQAISKYAPHPNAAKLWLEYLYSDVGQLMFLKGYTHPARYLDLAARHKIPAALARRLPQASAYKHVQFATLSQIKKATAVLMEQWGPKVSGS
jgi:putative spermidine/putrescine transport system substrate-binding protein